MFLSQHLHFIHFSLTSVRDHEARGPLSALYPAELHLRSSTHVSDGVIEVTFQRRLVHEESRLDPGPGLDLAVWIQLLVQELDPD